MKNRRVGTLTLGLTLIAVGILYLIYMFAPETVNLIFALRFWPVVMILLGGEVLISWYINREDRMRYDGWAIFLVICLIFFAWCMAGAEYILDYSQLEHLRLIY